MNLRNVKVHGLITLRTRVRLHKTGTTPLDLNFTAGLCLDILYVVTATADDLGSEVETTYRLEIHRNLLFRPFALFFISIKKYEIPTERHTRPNSSRSTCSGSRRRNRRSSTRFGKSCFIISFICATAASRPSFEVLVTRR